MERLARVGIISRGLVYLVVGLIAGEIALGHEAASADKKGALGVVSGKPFGRVLLIALCVGFGGYIVWQLLRALTPFSQARTPLSGAVRRLAAGSVALLYCGLLFAAITVLKGSGGTSSDAAQESWSARVLNQPGGRWLLGAVGVGVIAAGLGLAGFGLLRKFESTLATGRMDPNTRRAVVALGVAGWLARGFGFIAIGGFVLSAAVTANAGRSRGLDASLRTLAADANGTILILAVAAGIGSFGLYSFVEARYRVNFTD